ncbi:MAG: glycoside hydrolase family 43 protein [Bacteroidales bacterium]|nr:glycoside hydrolase family 43 protein [Bacteroidales bacterium]MBN2764103.1 glycoside hydrolase family 43 protein [Bacteroidales bacterium]
MTTCNTGREIYFFTSFHEPADEGLRLLYSYDGYHWTALDTVFLKPEVGKQKVMRDPSCVRGPDGTFHLVWTSSWRDDLGFGYASSKDLINWSEQKFIPVMAFDSLTVNVWAPELYYEEESREFFIIWASTIPYKFEKGIEEEKNNHRIYYTTTRDFKIFKPTKLFFDPGLSVIDAVIVKRGKEDYILVLKDNTRPNRNLKVAFSDSPDGPWNDISGAFTGFLTEGPAVVKPADEWLIYYDAYGDHTYRAAKTCDFIHFSDVTKEINIPEGHKHGTIFTANRKILRQLKKFCRN